MSGLTAKAAEEILKICNELIAENIDGEKACAEWRCQRMEQIESWAKGIKDAHTRGVKNDPTT
jgi:hypothetical protein